MSLNFNGTKFINYLVSIYQVDQPSYSLMSYSNIYMRHIEATTYDNSKILQRIKRNDLRDSNCLVKITKSRKNRNNNENSGLFIMLLVLLFASLTIAFIASKVNCSSYYEDKWIISDSELVPLPPEANDLTMKSRLYKRGSKLTKKPSEMSKVSSALLSGGSQSRASSASMSSGLINENNVLLFLFQIRFLY